MTDTIPIQYGTGGRRNWQQPLALGLIGFPVSHSLSPVLHCAALAAVGLAGEYHLFPVPPFPDGQELLVDLVMRVRVGELHGLNITIPHKQGVLALVDTLTETAAATQAVNTIYLDENQIIGENTDAPGFAAALKREFDQARFLAPSQGSAVILGAGGSARAVVYALDRAGWRMTLAARRPEQAGNLLDQVVQPHRRQMHTATGLNALEIGGCLDTGSPVDLVVNTTPVGMSPSLGSNPWPNELPLPENAFIYDLVYNPRETALVLLARQSGLPAVSGLGMLVEQAARSFECWTGIAAPVDAMYQVVASDTC